MSNCLPNYLLLATTNYYLDILKFADYCLLRSRYIVVKILCTLSNFAKINEAGIPIVVYINTYANLHNVRIFSDRNYLAYQQLLYAHYHFMQLRSFTSCNFIVWLQAFVCTFLNIWNWSTYNHVSRRVKPHCILVYTRNEYFFKFNIQNMRYTV